MTQLSDLVGERRRPQRAYAVRGVIGGLFAAAALAGCKFPALPDLVDADDGGVDAPADAPVDVPAGFVSFTVERSGFGRGSITAVIPPSTDTVLNCLATDETCTGVVPEGSLVRVTAIPANGDVFFGWSGGGCSGTSACDVTVNEASSVTATFDQCNRTVAESCDDQNNVFERCAADGSATTTVQCPLYCSQTVEKCVDINPSDNPSTQPLNALMDALAGTGTELAFPASCTATTCTINTDNGTITGASTGGNAQSNEILGNGRVFRVETLSVQGIVKVTGSRPLTILANGAITIRGILDASADLSVRGPGSQGQTDPCSGRNDRAPSATSAGAGGGGRYHMGGNGGSASGRTGAAGGAVQSEPTLIPLLGGCLGGYADENGGNQITNQGGGGGAVQLVSRRSISVLNGGVIDVSGGGGPSGNYFNTTDNLGGSGGGSGGSILLEAPVVTLDGATAVLSAKGGGGSAAGQRGFNGSDGGYGPGAAPGGTNASGAAGGAGGTETSPPGAGQPAQGIVPDGGGGGGSVGLCRINTRQGAVTVQNGAAIRCVRPSNTTYAERLIP